jgi:hypothetical protein
MLLEAVFGLEDVTAILTHTWLLITRIGCGFAWSSGSVAHALLAGESALLWMTSALFHT